MEEEMPKITIISEKEILCEKHGKQEVFDNEFKCPKCFNDYCKKRYFL